MTMCQPDDSGKCSVCGTYCGTAPGGVCFGSLVEVGHADHFVVTGARYGGRFVVLDLADGCSFSFPVDLVDDLAKRTNRELRGVSVIFGGVCWEKLDVHLSVDGLLRGSFGKECQP